MKTQQRRGGPDTFEELIRKHREARERVKSLLAECAAIGDWLSEVGAQLAESPWEVDPNELRRLSDIASLVTEYKKALAAFERVDEKYRKAWDERS